MAKSLTTIEKHVATQAEQDAESLAQIMSAVAQNKEGLIVFFDILNEMHQSGVLELVRGMLKSRQQIGVIGLRQLNKSGAQNFIKNSMAAVQFLGKLQPERLGPMLDAVAHGVASAQPADKPIGMLGMLGRLRDPEVNASMSMLLNFLRGMGEGLPHVH